MNIFFLYFDLRSDPESDLDPDFFFSAELDPDPWKKIGSSSLLVAYRHCKEDLIHSRGY